MTSPIAPIVLSQGGNEQSLGLLLRQLTQQRQNKIQQQQADTQRQQAETQALSQRTNARNQQMSRVLKLMDIFGVDVLEDQQVAQSLEEAGLNPQTLLRRHKVQVKEKEREQAAALDTMVQSLPEPLRQPFRIAANSLQAGFGQQFTNDMFNLAADLTRLTPEQEEALRAEFPRLANLPTDELVKRVSEIAAFRTQIDLGVGPEARRQAQTDIAQQRLQLTRTAADFRRQTGTARFRAAELLLGLAEDATNPFALAMSGRSELIGKSQEEAVRALYGPQIAAAITRAREVIAQALEPPTQP